MSGNPLGESLLAAPFSTFFGAAVLHVNLFGKRYSNHGVTISQNSFPWFITEFPIGIDNHSKFH
jgi:hypothetical protein